MPRNGLRLFFHIADVKGSAFVDKEHAHTWRGRPESYVKSSCPKSHWDGHWFSKNPSSHSGSPSERRYNVRVGRAAHWRVDSRTETSQPGRGCRWAPSVVEGCPFYGKLRSNVNENVTFLNAPSLKFFRRWAGNMQDLHGSPDWHHFCTLWTLLLHRLFFSAQRLSYVQTTYSGNGESLHLEDPTRVTPLGTVPSFGRCPHIPSKKISFFDFCHILIACFRCRRAH